MNRTGHGCIEAGWKPTLSALACVVVAGLFGLAAPTNAQQQTSAKPPVTILSTTEFLEWNQTDGTYIAKGDAHVKQGDTSIKADHIIASYQPDSASRPAMTQPVR